MVSRVGSAVLDGLLPVAVTVEVDGNRGIPVLVIVGLASRATEEARHRITSALRHNHFAIRSKRTVVNLAPANIPKSGTTLDLAMALGVLAMHQYIPQLDRSWLCIGELALDGSLRPIAGCLPIVLAAKRWGYTHIVIPKKNQEEVSLVEGVTMFPVTHLMHIVQHLLGQTQLIALRPMKVTPQRPTTTLSLLDQVVGQEQAKRVLTIAAAGGHHVLLTGPPGIGKTMLAQSTAELLPPLSLEEMLSVTAIYSAANLHRHQLVQERPFRMVLPTATTTMLFGGGQTLQPGELSLAHHGVLFFDELLEFPRQVIERLRYPLEHDAVSVHARQRTTSYPAACLILAATNPCPCGYFGSNDTPCRCTPGVRERYQQKLSGPVLERFPLTLQLATADQFQLQPPPAHQVHLAALVQQARDIQKERQATLNRNLTLQQVQSRVKDTATKSFLEQAATRLHLSPRKVLNTLRVAQTIADLEKKAQVTKLHIAEALQYRWHEVT